MWYGGENGAEDLGVSLQSFVILGKSLNLLKAQFLYLYNRWYEEQNCCFISAVKLWILFLGISLWQEQNKNQVYIRIEISKSLASVSGIGKITYIASWL